MSKDNRRTFGKVAASYLKPYIIENYGYMLSTEQVNTVVDFLLGYDRTAGSWTEYTFINGDSINHEGIAAQLGSTSGHGDVSKFDVLIQQAIRDLLS